MLAMRNKGLKGNRSDWKVHEMQVKGIALHENEEGAGEKPSCRKMKDRKGKGMRMKESSRK